MLTGPTITTSAAARLSPLFDTLRRFTADAHLRSSADLDRLRDIGVHPLEGGRNNALFSAPLDDQRICVKLHRQDGRRRDRREWDALTLLADAHAGLAPGPISYDNTPPPVLAMTTLPGHTLGERCLSADQIAALAQAHRALHAITPSHPAVPRLGTELLPVRLTDQGMAAQVTEFFADPDDSTALRGRLLRAWQRWRAGPDPEVLSAEAPPVFGQGDPNLTNCLWDDIGEAPAEGPSRGEAVVGKPVGRGRLSLIDFEYAGWSNQPYELALLIEHVQSCHTPDQAWRHLLDASQLTAWAERRTLAARRLVAWFWVMTFWPSTAADGARFRAQAGRLLQVLTEPSS